MINDNMYTPQSSKIRFLNNIFQRPTVVQTFKDYFAFKNGVLMTFYMDLIFY